ncbi:MAG: YkgJ family cysteine cluster protein [Minicystis sp.]
MSRRTAADPTDNLLAELAAIYEDADALYWGWSCPASTECCRFGITGREPYVTSIELLAVRRAIAARGGQRAWKRAPVVARDPEGTSTSRVALPVVTEERTCPLLDASGRCAAYASRPLGCRTFFCDRADAPGKVKQRDVNALVRRIQDLAAKHEPGGDKGRPLTRALT